MHAGTPHGLMPCGKCGGEKMFVSCEVASVCVIMRIFTTAAGAAGKNSARRDADMFNE